MPPRSRLTVTAVPLRRSNVNLEVFAGNAKRVVFLGAPPKTLLGSSYKRGSARETVIAVNRGRKPTVFYATVFVPGNAQYSDAAYRLILRRGPAG